MSALDRIDTLIDDVLTHARQGQSIGETATVPLSDLLENCRVTVELGDATLALEGDLQFEADPRGYSSFSRTSSATPSTTAATPSRFASA
jgi:hypothetical protein